MCAAVLFPASEDELGEIDPLDVQGAQAGLARGHEVACSPVGSPVALGTGEAAFVTHLAVVPAVRVGGVDKGRAGIEGGVQHRDRSGLVAVAPGRQPHAAHANQRTSRTDR